MFPGEEFSNNSEDEKESISAVRDDQIRENGMCMATAAANDAGDADRVINREFFLIIIVLM